MRHIPFIALFAFTACAQQNGTITQEGEAASSIDAPIMNYTKVDTANAEGFAKVTAGEGAMHAEGIIDAKGVAIIPPQTRMLVNDITGSTALVQVGRQFLFVDLANGPINTRLLATEKGYQYAEPFRCGRAMVQVDDRWFYIDSTGTQLFAETYDFAETFHHDRAMVKEGEHYRIIDTDGKTVAEMNYDQVNPQSPWCWQVTRI